MGAFEWMGCLDLMNVFCLMRDAQCLIYGSCREMRRVGRRMNVICVSFELRFVPLWDGCACSEKSLSLVTAFTHAQDLWVLHAGGLESLHTSIPARECLRIVCVVRNLVANQRRKQNAKLNFPGSDRAVGAKMVEFWH